MNPLTCTGGSRRNVLRAPQGPWGPHTCRRQLLRDAHSRRTCRVRTACHVITPRVTCMSCASCRARHVNLGMTLCTCTLHLRLAFSRGAVTRVHMTWTHTHDPPSLVTWVPWQRGSLHVTLSRASTCHSLMPPRFTLSCLHVSPQASRRGSVATTIRRCATATR